MPLSRAQPGLSARFGSSTHRWCTSVERTAKQTTESGASSFKHPVVGAFAMITPASTFANEKQLIYRSQFSKFKLEWECTTQLRLCWEMAN